MAVRRISQRMGVAPMAVAVAVAVTGAAGPADAAARFTPLADLSSPVHVLSRAYATSADGAVVVGEAASGTDTTAVVWRNGGPAEALPLPALDSILRSVALGVSADGSLVVGSVEVPAPKPAIPATIQQPVAWRLGPGGIEVLGPDRFGADASFSFALTDAADDGSAVIGTVESVAVGTSSGVRWSEAGGLEFLPAVPIPAGDFHAAASASADASVVAGVAAATAAVRWSATGGESLWSGAADAVSSDGNTVVGWSFPAQQQRRPIRWTAEEGAVELPLPDGQPDGEALGASGDGSVVAGSAGEEIGFQSYEPHEAFVWDAAHGTRGLQGLLADTYGVVLAGWTLLRADDISPDGHMLVGTGLNPDGATEAWLVDLPEPTGPPSTVLVGLTLAGLGRARRRARRPSRIVAFPGRRTGASSARASTKIGDDHARSSMVPRQSSDGGVR